VRTFAALADHLIAVEPDVDLINGWDAASTKSHSRKIGQLPVCWGQDRDACVDRAHELFRWFGGGWKVNAEIPGTAGFAGASQFVTQDDVAAAIPCGPDIEAIVKAVRTFEDAGFTDVALVQIGTSPSATSSTWPGGSCCRRCAEASAGRPPSIPRRRSTCAAGTQTGSGRRPR
jgi:G6PDH family F420-dependent oxidoreductase